MTLDPPCIPSMEQSSQPRCKSLSLCMDTHPSCCTVTNTNQPHLQATSGLFHPSHHLIGGCCLCSAFNASLLFSYYVSLPLYLSMKKNKIKFCQLHVSVVGCCRPCWDFLLHSNKAHHYKPHRIQLCGPSGATADTTSTGCSAMPLAPAALLFHLSGMPGFVQTCFVLHI